MRASTFHSSSEDLERGAGHDLHAQYERYRTRQVGDLLKLMPRAAVRDLYGDARDWAERRGLHDTRDPMATLVRFAGQLLPLPPFEVWAADRERNPLGHLDGGDAEALAESMTEPVDAARRRFDYRGRSWIACLGLFRDGRVWRGFISFEAGAADEGGALKCRTANVLLESTAGLVRDRFLELNRGVLSAFLRSALP